MRVEALTSFCGAISMTKGEERDIKNNVLLKDLLQAGYVKSLESENEILEDEDSTDENAAPEPENEEQKMSDAEQEVATSQKQPSKRGVKSNESK